MLRRKPRKHRDPVTEAVYAAVVARDRLCVGPRIGMEGRCDARLELDHVQSSGLGMRGPSELWNLVLLCSRHHRDKTEASRRWRPMLIGYLTKHYGPFTESVRGVAAPRDIP